MMPMLTLSCVASDLRRTDALKETERGVAASRLRRQLLNRCVLTPGHPLAGVTRELPAAQHGSASFQVVTSTSVGGCLMF